jgi:uncharacterized cupredoxin-like copper-binding protein
MMKRAYLLLSLALLLSGLFVLSACGGDSGSSASSTNNTNSGNSSNSSNNANSGNSSNSSTEPQEVRVVMGEMYFKPAMTTFKVGKAYRFVLVNEGKVEHEFTIAPPRKAGQTEKDEDAASLLDTDGLKPGQTRNVDFTFKKAAPAGTYEFECSYPGHYEGGMHVGIVVEA